MATKDRHVVVSSQRGSPFPWTRSAASFASSRAQPRIAIGRHSQFPTVMAHRLWPSSHRVISDHPAVGNSDTVSPRDLMCLSFFAPARCHAFRCSFSMFSNPSQRSFEALERARRTSVPWTTKGRVRLRVRGIVGVGFFGQGLPIGLGIRPLDNGQDVPEVTRHGNSRLATVASTMRPCRGTE